MKDKRELERLCYFLEKNKFPKEHNLFMNLEKYMETESWLSQLPHGVIIFKTMMSAMMPVPISIKFNGYIFNIYQY